MNRKNVIEVIKEDKTIWDIVVVGGGATGLGVALDAATRGYKTLLLEQDDFSKATSSRSTKLVHGGVRYLAQGDVGLVLEALKERGLMRKNAPHLVKDLSFIIPCYSWFDILLYTVGLTVYDIMAGRLGFGKSLLKNKTTTLTMLPNVKQDGLKGGVLYHDGSFDDSRMAINLAQSVLDNGGYALNYAKVTAIHKKDNVVCGVEVNDVVGGNTYNVSCRSIVNATGVFVDDILLMDDKLSKPMIKPSQGVHIVVDSKFLNSDKAFMIPKTSDKRVLFAIPWHGKSVIGTTDTLVDEISLEPRALDKEIDFILETASKYMSNPPKKGDIESVFAGLRPLAAPKEEGKNTKEISRSHKIIVSKSKLVTITGGKWTTYRRMAEDTVDKIISLGLLHSATCRTRLLKIHGYTEENITLDSRLGIYGSDASYILQMENTNPDLALRIHPNYPYTMAQVKWAVENEMAENVEDILARRLRVLFTDAKASIMMAEPTARLMAQLLNKDSAWEAAEIENYTLLAQGYIL